ncbi:MAG: EFR1 family ferrodoxin [Lachnospiraceae bacterium]
MKIKKIYQLFFSATGTTERIVSSMAVQLGEIIKAPVASIDFTPANLRTHTQEFTEGDLVIVGVPVYAGRVPNVLLPYLQKMLAGNGALAIPVVLYGNRNYDDALIELRDLLEADGFHTVGAAAFIGEHSFSYDLAKGRPDEQDMKIVELFSKKMAEQIQTGTENLKYPIPVKGETPLRPYYTPRDRQGNSVNILKVKPLTKDSCTQCGICASVCPMGSIQAEDCTQITGICIKCGACVKKCPIGAKYYEDEGYLYHQHELEAGYTRRAEPELFLG